MLLCLSLDHISFDGFNCRCTSIVSSRIKILAVIKPSSIILQMIEIFIINCATLRTCWITGNGYVSDNAYYCIFFLFTPWITHRYIFPSRQKLYRHQKSSRDLGSGKVEEVVVEGTGIPPHILLRVEEPVSLLQAQADESLPLQQ